MNAEDVAPRGWLTRLKASCFTRGVRLSQAAGEVFTRSGRVPLTIHEYATTGGLTFEVAGGVYINAPFDEWFVVEPEAEIGVTQEGTLEVRFDGRAAPIYPVPLPGYLDRRDDAGRSVRDVAMSHVDRIRLSPIGGCSFACKFCDLAGLPYYKRPVDQILAALRVAKEDDFLPPRHVLVSGGTPSPLDEPYLESVVCAVAQEAGMPVDVMMSPKRDSASIDRMVEAGVDGFAINIELFGDEASRTITPQKFRLGRQVFDEFIERAVDVTGGKGRVRSLIIVGIEPVEATLAGVEHLARMGADPALSPFRPPAPGQPLAQHPPPSPETLLDVYERSLAIAQEYGVRLGPRCVPCQHNTFAMPHEVS